jgi:putative transposase
MIEITWGDDLYGYLWGKADALDCITHAINGMEDHVHIVVSIPPKFAVATIIGKLKGSSSHHINHAILTDRTFAWQAEYGIVTFSERYLPVVVAYVQNQKQHHADGMLWENLESLLFSKPPVINHRAKVLKDNKLPSSLFNWAIAEFW